MHMYVCTYVHHTFYFMYTCTFICLCVYRTLFMFDTVCTSHLLCTYLNVHMYVHMYITFYVHTYIHTYLSLCTHVGMFARTLHPLSPWTPSTLNPEMRPLPQFLGHLTNAPINHKDEVQIESLKWDHPSNLDTFIGPKGGWSRESDSVYFICCQYICISYLPSPLAYCE